MSSAAGSVGRKTYNGTSRLFLARYFEAFVWFVNMPSAVCSYAITLLDENDAMGSTPIVRILRLWRMPGLIPALLYLIAAFSAFPIAAAMLLNAAESYVLSLVPLLPKVWLTYIA